MLPRILCAVVCFIKIFIFINIIILIINININTVDIVAVTSFCCK